MRFCDKVDLVELWHLSDAAVVRDPGGSSSDKTHLICTAVLAVEVATVPPSLFVRLSASVRRSRLVSLCSGSTKPQGPRKLLYGRHGALAIKSKAPKRHIAGVKASRQAHRDLQSPDSSPAPSASPTLHPKPLFRCRLPAVRGTQLRVLGFGVVQAELILCPPDVDMMSRGP